MKQTFCSSVGVLRRLCVFTVFFQVVCFSPLALPLLAADKTCSVVPVDLRCEHQKSPVIGVEKPRFSWTLKAQDPKAFGQRQTAYRIVVQRLKHAHSELAWDSNWVKSDQMQLIEYKGQPLRSDSIYFWFVRVQDEQGCESTTALNSFCTGILDPSLWTAKWIGSDELFDQQIGIKRGDCNVNDPWLRKTFELEKNVDQAHLYVASVGYHEVYVNGQRIDEKSVLAPAVTDHTKRARYIQYDIAQFLKPGKNTLALWLGTSWSIFPGYKDPKLPEMTTDVPRTPIVYAQADIYYNESYIKEEPALKIVTDETWKTKPSPNRLLGTWDFRNMGGDLWDDNKAETDWNLPGYDDSTWKSATVYRPKLKLSPQGVEKNRLFEEIKPVSLEDKGNGVYRFDMGVNFAGWTQIKLTGEPGQKIDIRFSERIQDEMTFNNYSAFILGASGKGTFKNRFNYSSGRWITVRGLKEKPTLDDVRGWMVRTDFQRATQFECSDELQNWIYNTINWTFENLALGGFVVDCPQRERMGYGGDAHATSETAMFNYQLGAFYTKWLEDWRDTQGTEAMVGDMNNPDWARKAVTSGRILGGGIQPHTAPTYWGGGGPAWGGICVTLPWFLYQHEGDKRALEENYKMASLWLEFLDENSENDLLKRFGGQWDFLGDWLWPNATAEGMNNDSPQTLCLNNCYRVFNLRTAAKIARTLGKTEEAEKWERKAEAASQAIQKEFYNADDHSYADKSMACLAAALLGDVMPEDLRDTVMKRLEKEILEVRKGYIHVGITGGAMLFKVLRDTGRDDLIYSMTSKIDYPSWGHMKLNDATTIWEMWEKDLPGHSLLHSSYLYPGAWYVDGVAGIKRDPQHPGFKRFIVRPPMLDEKQVSWAKAAFDSPVGEIKVDWKRQNGVLTLDTTVPANVDAVVYFPVGKNGIQTPQHAEKRTQTAVINGQTYAVFDIGPGTYRFTDSSVKHDAETQ